MLKYEQSSGKLYTSDGMLLGEGYSGAPAGKNNPLMQAVKDIGPIPCGLYYINAPVDTVTHGPYVLGLTPVYSNEMFGREGFLIHGDSLVDPGTASEGCIVMPKTVRTAVWASGDRQLEVV